MRDFQQPQFCTSANMRMAARVIAQFYDERLRPVGLRSTQFTLLATVERTGQITISDLAERMVVDRTTLTRNVVLLEQQGLLLVVAGEDNRTRLVGITDAGRTKLVAAMPLWQAAQAAVIHKLGPESWNELLETLSSTVAALSER